jgi:Domain of unknown function (DUF4456)
MHNSENLPFNYEPPSLTDILDVSNLPSTPKSLRPSNLSKFFESRASRNFKAIETFLATKNQISVTFADDLKQQISSLDLQLKQSSQQLEDLINASQTELASNISRPNFDFHGFYASKQNEFFEFSTRSKLVNFTVDPLRSNLLSLLQRFCIDLHEIAHLTPQEISDLLSSELLQINKLITVNDFAVSAVNADTADFLKSFQQRSKDFLDGFFLQVKNSRKDFIMNQATQYLEETFRKNLHLNLSEWQTTAGKVKVDCLQAVKAEIARFLDSSINFTEPLQFPAIPSSESVKNLISRHLQDLNDRHSAFFTTFSRIKKEGEKALLEIPRDHLLALRSNEEDDDNILDLMSPIINSFNVSISENQTSLSSALNNAQIYLEALSKTFVESLLKTLTSVRDRHCEFLNTRFSDLKRNFHFEVAESKKNHADALNHLEEQLSGIREKTKQFQTDIKDIENSWSEIKSVLQKINQEYKTPLETLKSIQARSIEALKKEFDSFEASLEELFQPSEGNAASEEEIIAAAQALLQLFQARISKEMNPHLNKWTFSEVQEFFTSELLNAQNLFQHNSSTAKYREGEINFSWFIPACKNIQRINRIYDFSFQESLKQKLNGEFFPEIEKQLVMLEEVESSHSILTRVKIIDQPLAELSEIEKIEFNYRVDLKDLENRVFDVSSGVEEKLRQCEHLVERKSVAFTEWLKTEFPVGSDAAMKWFESKFESSSKIPLKSQINKFSEKFSLLVSSLTAKKSASEKAFTEQVEAAKDGIRRRLGLGRQYGAPRIAAQEKVSQLIFSVKNPLSRLEKLLNETIPVILNESGNGSLGIELEIACLVLVKSFLTLKSAISSEGIVVAGGSKQGPSGIGKFEAITGYEVGTFKTKSFEILEGLTAGESVKTSFENIKKSSLAAFSAKSPAPEFLLKFFERSQVKVSEELEQSAAALKAVEIALKGILPQMIRRIYREMGNEFSVTLAKTLGDLSEDLKLKILATLKQRVLNEAKFSPYFLHPSHKQALELLLAEEARRHANHQGFIAAFKAASLEKLELAFQTFTERVNLNSKILAAAFDCVPELADEIGSETISFSDLSNRYSEVEATVSVPEIKGSQKAGKPPVQAVSDKKPATKNPPGIITRRKSAVMVSLNEARQSSWNEAKDFAVKSDLDVLSMSNASSRTAELCETAWNQLIKDLNENIKYYWTLRMHKK